MSETTPKEQRGPTNLRIKFRSASLEQFIERYAADVSRGGIFIRTREPLAVGTQLRLELQLQDMTPLINTPDVDFVLSSTRQANIRGGDMVIARCESVR